MAPTTADLSSPVRIAGWRDYIQLLKPRVMSLVVFTALTGMVCAGHPLNPALAAIALLAIAVGAGGSAALNMAYVAAGSFEVFYATSINAWDVAAGVVLDPAQHREVRGGDGLGGCHVLSWRGRWLGCWLRCSRRTPPPSQA